jgi:hypothetical protein
MVSRFKARTILELLPNSMSYRERERGYGQGDVRLGTFLEMDDSIYSLGFLSQINDKIMDEYFDTLENHMIGLDLEEFNMD